MINPEDDIIVDFRTSITKEEVVARLLAGPQDALQLPHIQVTESGVSLDQLPRLLSQGGTLIELLMERREAARRKLADITESGDTSESVEEKMAAVHTYDQLLRLAKSYMVDIDDELSKGEGSNLRIDKAATEETGTIHITLGSADNWAQTRYGIGVVRPAQGVVSKVAPSSQPAQGVESKVAPSSQPEQGVESKVAPSSQPAQSGASEDSKKSGLSRVMADNLYTTFAFLLEAHSQTSERFGKGSKPNKDALAKRIAEVATNANGGIEMKNQSVEAIKNRIENAMKVKREKLPAA